MASIVQIIIKAKDRATESINRVRGGMMKLTNSVDKIQTASQGMLDFGVRVGIMGAAMSAALAVPIKSAATFEQAMARVKAVSGATDTQFAALTKTARELGRTTKFSATEAAGGMNFLAMAGFKATEIIKAMPSVLQLAAAANLDLASAADITSNIMTGYGMKAKDLSMVNDVLVKSFTSTNTNLVQLGQAMKYVGPIAKSAGISFEETAAAIGLLGNAGIQGSMAGTSLRRIIGALIKPVGAGGKALDKLGIIIKDKVTGKFVGLSNIIEQFQTKFKGLQSDTEKTGTIMTIFGKIAGPAMAALLDQGSEAMDKLIQDYLKANGIAKSMSDIALDTATGAFIKLTSAINGFLISIGSPFLKPLQKLTELMASLVTQATKASEASGPLGTIIFGITGLLGTLLVIAGGLALAIGGIGFVLVGVVRGFEAWSNILPILSKGLGLVSGATVMLEGVMLPLLGTLGLIALAFGAGLQLGKWFMNVGFIRKWAETEMTYLDGFLTWLHIKALEVEKLLTKMFTFGGGKASTDAIDKQIAALERHQAILVLVRKDIYAEGTAQQKSTEATKEGTKAIEGQTEAQTVQKKSYEDLMDAIEEGSAQYMSIRTKELATLKANMDYELALEKQRYDEGKTSLEDFVNFKLDKQREYTDEMIKLKEMEVESLKAAPTIDPVKVKAIEEEIKQIKIKSAMDQLNIQTQLTSGIKKSQEDAFSKWRSLQDLKIKAMKSQFKVEDEYDFARVKNDFLRESDFYARKQERAKEFYQARIKLATESLAKIAEIEGTESQKYKKTYSQRLELQRELQIQIIRSEEGINENRAEEEKTAQKFVAELTENRIKLAQIEKKEKLKILNKYHEQGLINTQEYSAAIMALGKQVIDTFSDELSKSSAQLTIWASIITERTTRMHESIKGLITNSFEDVKQYFGTASDALTITVSTVRTQIDGFLNAINHGTAETFWKAELFGRKMVDMVGTNIYDWASRVTDYINYVKNLMDDLRGTIEDYRKQLLRLRGNEIGLVEMWYQDQLSKIKEKFKDLSNSKEYRKAIALLKQLYDEKLKRAKESMKKEEDSWKEHAKKIAAISTGIDNKVKSSVSGVTTISPAGAAPEVVQGASVQENIQIDNTFKVQTFDSDTAKRWLRDTVFPEFERQLRLKGIKL